MREPKIGDVVEVYCASTFRGIGILVPRRADDSVPSSYKQFVQWIATAENDICYKYGSGDYGIGVEHQLKVVWSPA